MSLKGSLETVALPEVLHLLADTSKSGELYVQGGQKDGRLWFDAGSLAGFDVAGAAEHFEAIFELLRNQGGEFSFDDTSTSDSEDRHDLAPELERAEARFAEWCEIVAVVPSHEHLLHLPFDAPEDEVTLARPQWTMLVAIGSGSSVAGALDIVGLREFEGFSAVRELVDRGLVAVSEPADQAVSEVEVAPEVEVVVAEEPAAVVAHADAHEEVSAEHTGARYEALWAAAMEAEEHAPAADTSEAGTQDGEVSASTDEAHSYAIDEVPTNGRDALQALLAEVSADTDAGHSDGLEDRGPWTSQELEQMGSWSPDGSSGFRPGSGYDASFDEEGAESYESLEEAHGSAEYAVADDSSDQYPHGEHYEAEPTGEEEVPEGQFEAEAGSEVPADEPINRGLLLKFLSSVRN